MGQRIAAGALLLVWVALAACTSATAPTTAPTAAATPAPPAFDLVAVKAKFIHECKSPDTPYCEQVKIADMTADGIILMVPTTLSPVARDLSQQICNAFVFGHVDSYGKPLGYEVVEILDVNGGTNAACSVD